MNTIGIRVKPAGVTFAVLNTRDQQVINVETIKVPKAMQTPDALKYIRNNILDIIREYEVSHAGLRVTESTAQTLSVPRIEIEGVIQEAFASSTLKSYYCGQIATIASRVGIPRGDFKPYVEGLRMFSPVENWGDLDREEREAVFAALGAISA